MKIVVAGSADPPTPEDLPIFTNGMPALLCTTTNKGNQLSLYGKAVPTESRCGWLKDKFVVSWQVLPTILGKFMTDPNKAGKAAQAFMQMRKFDIEKIVPGLSQQAY
ncbi:MULTISPECIES: VOC family protein [Niastella]|uniref:VOC family protein n=1 Tax=Niastella soli TaxID=2821487 RepID=A0ABS3YRF7_9BACT|nr:VOC family protein [Niastella soli]MBO9200492.1 VOC family protein [Niastella soli]